MGCGASTVDGAEPRRRGWARARALGHSEVSTTGLPVQGQQGQESAGRRRGSKVAPEPTPGSPSFRYYCQKTAAVDKIVAEADNGDCSVSIVRATTRQASNRDEVAVTIAHEPSQVSEHKEGARWLRFRGLSMVTSAWGNLFSRHTSKHSPPTAAESHDPPPAAAAAV
ncbi:hypothetical protein PAHAL_5G034900 [Panicum hallii]|uniref:Uncharacterized protein n=1 Tax=Panicum hallii TaxID=206008 RepID=A0A2T8IIU4_9POAL|nr:uncharacterized protein LOC112892276 [Panicum hallii]PVH37577.1 hypothetical protein PAHAL_5G034900 [Panicum hallii]